MARVASLTIGDKKIDLPVIVGSEGEVGIDIAKLRQETGAITYDPGLGNTGACQSAITFIDGDKGYLRYRGIPIEQLAERSNFIETAWLLIFGKLPTRAELDRFAGRLGATAPLYPGFENQFSGYPKDAPPMAILSAMINTISCFNYDLANPDSDEAFEEAAARLISKVRTIAAAIYRMANALTYVAPDPSRSYVSNFLHMMFSKPGAAYELHAEVEDALDLILTLHADHEQNCSTSTVRVVGSSKANLFASCAAGVCALWGPLHGGANAEVLEMLGQIHAGGITADEYLKQVKEKKVLLYGFGHRVYKNFDPRAKILKEASDKVLAKLGVNDPLLDIARKLEELALKDSYFVDRKLYPNVDFYSGIIMKAIGIPVNMFTVLFAIGRMPGWIAQWKEQRDEGGRIARPRQIYTGPTRTDYAPIESRG
ncbi:MAG TPA: citrate synthase [Tepidisphaeraceae bacterium]|jgi:citrate synthase